MLSTPGPASAHTTPTNTLVACAYGACVGIGRAASLLAYVASSQQPTVTLPPASEVHPVTSIIKEYVSHGLLVEVGLEWYLHTTCKATDKGSQNATLTTTDTAFF